MSLFACNLSADDLSSDMCLKGLAVQSLHGDREQRDREEALKDFKESALQEGGKSSLKKCFTEKTEMLVFSITSKPGGPAS